MITDEMLKVAQDTYDEYSMRRALEAVAPMLIAEGLREAVTMPRKAALALAQELDPK